MAGWFDWLVVFCCADQTIDEVLARVEGSSDLAQAVADADYIQECVPEKLEIKRAVFQQVCTTASTMSHLILSLACNSAAVIVSFGC